MTCRLTRLCAALANSNYISPSGNAKIDGKYPIVPVNSVVTDIQTLGTVPIRSGQYPAVFVKDVGEIVDSSDIVTCYALVNGRRTVYIPVTKRSDASTLAVVEAVKENLPRFQGVVPSDIKVSYEFDQAPFVTRAIAGLTMEGGLGALLTGLMVLVFLLDWRSVFIVVLNIPLALLGAVLALWLTNQTVNIMTLGGLALAVGILVDTFIVTIEKHSHTFTDGESCAESCGGFRQRSGPTPTDCQVVCSRCFPPSLFHGRSGQGIVRSSISGCRIFNGGIVHPGWNAGERHRHMAAKAVS